jgi:hypothetical protein
VYLNGVQGDCAETLFDVEVLGYDIDFVQTTADALKTALNGYIGYFSLDFARAVFVQDHSDDYLPRSMVDDDQGLHVATFQLRIFHAV